ncbi:class I SAM-dependent methyltransferase [Chitinophaga sp. YIM B06452]|uniref:class I SAM-dependent methyltransferase n=1 Tax=Chitinophaga sp. YIM B06452 TaxID=3082158 RepID=UPI0031FEDE2B
MKDNFSVHAGKYAKFRPQYPEALFDYLLDLVPERNAAWDCGTGNGQVASRLAQHFNKVYATDISRQQIEQAKPNPKIEYSVQPAEETNFPDRSFDIVTVAQAIHWFDFDAFYREVNRTLKKGGILAVTGYGLLHVTPAVDTVIRRLYVQIVGQYWDRERKYIDENYMTIPFPYTALPSPYFEHTEEWSLEHLKGYLSTWSAVDHYMQDRRTDPVELISDDLKAAWGKESLLTVRFPILLRTARV